MILCCSEMETQNCRAEKCQRACTCYLCMLSCVDTCVNRGVEKVATNLSIDTNLLDEALIIGGLPTKKDTVNQALTEFVQRRKQREIVDLFGSLPADKDYNYKKGRK